MSALVHVYLVELREHHPGLCPDECTVMHVASTEEKAISWSKDPTNLTNVSALPWVYAISKDGVDSHLTDCQIVGFVGPDGVLSEDCPESFFADSLGDVPSA